MIKVDKDYRDLLPDLTAEEYTGLEKDIIEHGIISPIVLWNGTIVDGHNRYKIARAHRFPESKIPTKDISFESKSQAMEWIINNQKSRRNLQKSELVIAWSAYEEKRGEEAQARMFSGKKDPSSNLNEGAKKPIRTAKEVAEKIGVSENTYRGMKYIMDKGTKDQIKRMDKGGTGNSVSAIVHEIKTKDKPDRTCPKCGQTYPAVYFRDGKAICKYCANKKRVENKRSEMKDVKGNIMQDSGKYKDVSDSEIIGNLYVNDVSENISIKDVVEEFNVNLESSLVTLERVMKTHIDLVATHKDEITQMWNNATEKINQLKGRYV